MNPFSVHGFMGVANIAKSDSGYCVNHVYELGWGQFSLG